MANTIKKFQHVLNGNLTLYTKWLFVIFDKVDFIVNLLNFMMKI